MTQDFEEESNSSLNPESPKKKSSFWKILLLFTAFGLIAGAGFGWSFYQKIYAPNVTDNNGQAHDLLIPTGATYDQVKGILKGKGILKDVEAFDWVAKQMNYPNKIYPGRYVVKSGWGNRTLVTKLRRGEQEPLNIIVNNIRTKAQLIDLVESQLEADSTELVNLLNDDAYLRSKGFDKESVMAVFISDTYQYNWNTSAEQYFERALKEYKKFWSNERKVKADKLKFTPIEVTSLAAIVEEEAAKNDEMPRIAGVYVNRLKTPGWRLDADPTLKFALGNFELKRILDIHKEVDSPYNTYKNDGLPPGPIRIPSKIALDAVLNAEAHEYMFFCAKEDFSGYHNFAKSYSTHILNAKRYQKALNERKIFK
ncbi:MAG: endolytic transglycosylase MltG [Chitinophagales bacterium]